MPTDSLTILQLSAIALIILLLAMRLSKKHPGGLFKSFTAPISVMHDSAPIRFFEPRHTPALKPCPNCAKQLPLSALICEACDYNFLSARPGRGQNMLPPPESMTDEAAEPKFASAAL